MYTQREILAQLEAMRAPRDSVIIMHSSLRSVGDVEGGAEGLLDVLVEYFTAEGGLFCVPVHTWRNFGKPDRYTLDVTSSENSLGAFSTVAAADPRAIRSENPTHSLAVFGDLARAEKFIADDATVKTATAPASCYGKLFEMGGSVLLVGVSHAQNTYLHCVAELLGLPNRMADQSVEVTVKRATGEIVSRSLTGYYCDFTSDISARFPKYETAFRYHGGITDGFIGRAPTQLCDARIMKETVALIWKNANGVDPLINERTIPPKWYCN